MIHAEGLTKNFNDFCAVDHIDIHIKKGEILGLLGPNGAGKTTTLRMLTGYFLPTSGRIRVKDYVIQENLLEIKKLIGYLPESAPLYHGMMVYDYLNFVAGIRGIQKNEIDKRIRDLADLCGLNQNMHNTIGALSKGFKQRVGLAHAMMDDPEILVLDEPTSGLDPNQIVEIREIIKAIGKEKTIILSTHILSEAEATCDRIVIINRGKIIADGTTQSLRQSSQEGKIISMSLMNVDFPTVCAELEPLGIISKIEKIDGTESNVLEIRMLCKTTDDPRPVVYEKVKQTDWILLEFNQKTKPLETIFQELTSEN